MLFRLQSIFFYVGTQSEFIRYSLAILFVIAATFTTIYIPVIGNRAAFLLFFFGIIQTSFWLGLNPGILATLLSLAAVNLFVLFPASIEANDVLLLNAGFCLVSTIMVITTSFHRRLAEALWQNRQDFAHAQTVGQIGSWRLNLGRNQLTWSDENHRIFGVPKGTPMTYEDFLAIVHPDDREYVDRAWQAALRGQPYDIEHRLLVADQVKWVREKAVLEFDKKGHLLGGFGTTQDITERMGLLDQLTKVAASVPGLICSFRLRPDGSACMPYASPVIESIYGLTLDEVSQDFSPIFARIHPDDIEHIHDTIAESARTQQHWRDTYRYNHPTKGEVWLEGHSVPLREMDGSVLWHGYIQDITERKLSENTLRDRENELRLIMDSTPALISYLDTDFRYLRVNATYEKWFGITEDQIVGRKAEEVIGKTAWNMVETYLHRARDGEQVSFDQPIPYGDAPSRWVHATYMPNIDATGRVKGVVAHVFDIGERIRSEYKIAQLNQRLQRRVQEMQAIFNTVPIGLSIADNPNCQHIRGNPAIERMLGLPRGSELSVESEIAPATISVMQNDVELAVEDLPMQRAVRGEFVTNQIIEIIRPDSQVITALCNASPLYDEEGKPRGAVGAFLDITALRQTEKSLAKSQLQLRLFVEQAPISIAMFDRNMNYLVTSRRWIEDFGRGYDDLTGRNHYDVNPDLPLEWKRVHRQALAGAFLKNDDDEWIQADGNRHWLRWTAYPWTNPAGEIGGIMISCEDISARRKAEQELRDSEARLALVVAHVNAGYWDWDLVSRKLFLSPEVKRQIGFDDSDSLNHREDWVNRLHPDDLDFVLGGVDKYIAGHQPSYEAEFRLRHKDGSYRWIHSRSVLLSDANHRPYRMLGINLDITDYMKQKELSDRRDKIEQSFRLSVAVQTAAAIAHELHQPLTAISSYSDVALHLLQTGEPNTHKLSQVLRNCSIQAQRAGEVIRQLMALLQKGEVPSEPIDINTSIHEAIDLVKADGLLDHFKIETDLAADLPRIKANSLQIQKVLINLLRNGLESMREQPNKADKITVTTCRSALDAAMAQVTVRDSGKGVADTVALRKIFQPFYTTKPDGLGMGLAISRSLIVAHGGKMWAEQNASNGIAIHFTLPFLI